MSDRALPSESKLISESKNAKQEKKPSSRGLGRSHRGMEHRATSAAGQGVIGGPSIGQELRHRTPRTRSTTDRISDGKLVGCGSMTLVQACREVEEVGEASRVERL